MRKLVIKAANGSVEDFNIDAQLNWTVKEIKAHIYRQYPTHPPVSCQKLVHGGRLLLDQSTLSEAIPLSSPEADEPTVIHLVAYEHSKSAPSTTSVTGTAERVHSSASNAQGSEGGSEATSRQPSLDPVQDSGGRDSRERLPEQPTQRMPPVMNPWLRHRGPMLPNQMPPMQHLPPNLMPAMQNMAGGVANPFLQAPQFYQSPYGAMYANQLQQWYYNYYRTPVEANVGGEVAREDQNPLDLPAMNPNEPADLPEEEDEEDIPVNGPGGLMMAGGGAGPGIRRRDLVDYLYMLSMIGFLVLMALLTGSLGRLLIFAAGIIFMVLNQAGFFSLQRRRLGPLNPRPQGPEVVREEAREVDREVQGEEVADGPDSGQDAAAEVEAPDDLSPPRAQAEGHNQPQQLEQHPGILATVLVFITSLFTSLLPQQRPDIQVN